MATKNSTLAEVQATRGIDVSSKLMPTDWAGRVRIATGSYKPTKADAAETVINLAKLPASARVLPSSKLYFEAGQDATTTVQVGDAGEDDRYLAAVAVGATASTVALSANALDNTLLDKEQFITLTTGVAALTIGKVIAFEIFYVID